MDNNTAERCMRPSSWAGRTSCLSVLSGLALTVSGELNKVNPLTYITYLLENVRKTGVQLLRPDQFGKVGNDFAVAS